MKLCEAPSTSYGSRVIPVLGSTGTNGSFVVIKDDPLGKVDPRNRSISGYLTARSPGFRVAKESSWLFTIVGKQRHDLGCTRDSTNHETVVFLQFCFPLCGPAPTIGLHENQFLVCLKAGLHVTTSRVPDVTRCLLLFNRSSNEIAWNSDKSLSLSKG